MFTLPRSLSALCIALSLSLTAASASAQGTGYWHTSGNQILDANGTKVRIAGINWYGFETTRAVAGGLTSQDYKTVLQTIKNLGYNTIRVPMSNQMVESPSVPSSISYSNSSGPINSDLNGLNSLQILDKIVSYAGTLGLKIILDNHRSEAGDSAEGSGLWFTGSYPESAWIADWTNLANRYLNNPTVVGVDLRNEPHNAFSGGACWSCGGTNDWHLAAERAGNAVLSVNPKLLIFVEGTDAYTSSDYYWWGGNLEGVQSSPVVLNVSNQLVYSAHDYGPAVYGQSWFNGSTTYASLSSVWATHWAYISKNSIAPVWLGEFGTPNDAASVQSSQAGSEGQWFQLLVQYLGADANLNWTYWALNGEDSLALLDSNYDATPVSSTKQSMLSSIQFPLHPGSTTAAPAAPSNLTASASGSGSVSLAWTASTTNGVTYTVYFGTTSGSTSTVLVSNVSGTTYAATGLNPSTTYYFTVTAVSSGSSSAASNQASATTPAAPAPVAPSNLSASAVSSSQIDLTWTPSSTSGATYTVYLGTSSGSSNLIASGVTGTSYSATSLTASTSYYFTIKAAASGTTSAASNQASATTSAAPVPVAPSNLSATAASSSQINLNWIASSTSGATYTVYSGSGSVVASGISGSSYSATGLAASTTYTFTVKAVVGNATSAASNQASASTPAAAVPLAPSNLSASAASSSQINLTWTPSSTSGATYNVYSGTTSGSSNLIASGVSGSSYAATGLTASTTYYFTVKAVVGSGTSAVSNQASATTQAASSSAVACHVTYLAHNDWGSGFTGNLSITNNGSKALTSWTVSWTYSGNQQITTAWNSNYSQSGHAVVLTNASWNGTISAGSTLTGIGWNANYSGTNANPTTFYLNGTQCQ